MNNSSGNRLFIESCNGLWVGEQEEVSQLLCAKLEISGEFEEEVARREFVQWLWRER